MSNKRRKKKNKFSKKDLSPFFIKNSKIDEGLFNNEKSLHIHNEIKIGTFEEVEGMELSAITKNDKDNQKLNGLILRGYETRFNDVNANAEVYDPNCLNKFIEEYFIKRGFNLTVDIQHLKDIMHLAGRVISIEINNNGFYFVVYIPKTYIYYEVVKNLIAEGILQGFSKEAVGVKYEIVRPENANPYIKFLEINISSLSLVATPANFDGFDKVDEIQNALTFVNKYKEKNNGQFEDMFK